MQQCSDPPPPSPPPPPIPPLPHELIHREAKSKKESSAKSQQTEVQCCMMVSGTSHTSGDTNIGHIQQVDEDEHSWSEASTERVHEYWNWAEGL